MGLDKQIINANLEYLKGLYETGMSYYEISLYLKNNFGIMLNPESVRYYITRRDKPKVPKLDKLKQDGIEKVLIISDLHIPYHRDDVLDIVTKHKDEVSLIVFNGDIIDCKPISKYKELDKGELIDEMVVCHELLKKIDDLTPNARKVIVLGNHENRAVRYMATVQSEFNSLHTSNIMREITDGFKKVDHVKGKVTYYNKLDNYEVLDTWYFEYNGMICCHPLSYSKIPARTAYNAVEYFTRNGFVFDVCLVAHTHHFGSCFNLGKYCVETGCLCKPQSYASTGKLNFVPQDCGYHLAVFKDGKYDVNESRQYILN